MLTPVNSYPCALFCTFLHSRKSQPVCFHDIPHSSSKNTRGWGTSPHDLRREPSAESTPSRCVVGAQHAAPFLDRISTMQVYRSSEENTLSATSIETASMSEARDRSSVTFGDLARTDSYAFLASAPVCSGASKSIPWQPHSNSIAIVCRKLINMRSSR